MRKNLILTLWLLLPILVFSGLVFWIFASGARLKLMDAEAVGPGAADTGGANALGEWLRGRDPNLVERANIARREGRAVDPFWWPGGTELAVDASGVPGEAPVTAGWIDAETGILRAVALSRETAGAEVWTVVLTEHRPGPGTPVYLVRGGLRQVIRGDERAVIDDAGGTVLPMVVPPQSVGQTLASEAIRVELPLPPG